MITRKRTSIPFLLFSVCLILSAALSAWADTRYVSDRLIISMREGSSPVDPAVAFIVAGTPVEVLEEADDHLLIRIADGKEGWVKKKYIVAERPKSMVINEMKIKIEELEKQIESMGTQAGAPQDDAADVREIYEIKIKNLETVLEKEKQSTAATRAELKDLKNRNNTLQEDVGRLTEQNTNLSKQANDEALKSEIQRLQQANQALVREMDQMQATAQPSVLPSGIKWFLIGGGVLLLGIILGRSVRRKNPYGY